MKSNTKRFIKLFMMVSSAVILTFSSAAMADVTNIFSKNYPPVDFGAVPEAAEKVMADGTVIDGADVGGLTLQKAKIEVSKAHSSALLQTATLNLGDVKVDVNLRQLGVDFAASDICAKALDAGSSDGLLISRYKNHVDFEALDGTFNSEIEIDEEILNGFVKTELPAYEVDSVQNAAIKRENGQFIITPEKNGVAVDTEATAQLIKDTISANGITGTLSIDVACQVKEADIKASDLEVIGDVLGTFSTDVDGSDNRAHNVALGSSNINGTLLMPGESASTSELMKKRTKENGYRLAPQYVDGDSVDAYGGGVCQVSSTLYNALLRAEIQIDSRFPHSMKVSYVKPSLDAAISWGFKDTKFTNNLDYPIYIEGASVNRVCTFTIYGKETRDTVNRTVKFVSTIVSERNPEDKVIYDPNQPVGYKSTTGVHHPEVISYMEKIVYVNGVEVSREKLNSDHYYSSIRTIVIGTGGVDPGAEQPAPETPTQPTQPPTEAPTAAPTEPPTEDPGPIPEG